MSTLNTTLLAIVASVCLGLPKMGTRIEKNTGLSSKPDKEEGDAVKSLNINGRHQNRAAG